MSTIDTNVYVNKDELGKNLYRKKTYYTLCIEQECLAKNKDEADDKMSECGIDHSKIGKDITEEKDGVETYMVDANYTDSDKTEFIAKVVYDDYDGLENAKENGDVELSTYANETDVINDKGELVSEAENDCNSIQKSIDDLDKVEAKADKESVPF